MDVELINLELLLADLAHVVVERRHANRNGNLASASSHRSLNNVCEPARTLPVSGGSSGGSMGALAGPTRQQRQWRAQMKGNVQNNLYLFCLL